MRLIFEKLLNEHRLNLPKFYEEYKARYPDGGLKYRYIQWILGKLSRRGILSRHRDGKRGPWYYEFSTEFALLIKRLYITLRKEGKIA